MAGVIVFHQIGARPKKFFDIRLSYLENVKKLYFSCSFVALMHQQQTPHQQEQQWHQQIQWHQYQLYHQKHQQRHQQQHHNQKQNNTINYIKNNNDINNATTTSTTTTSAATTTSTISTTTTSTTSTTTTEISETATFHEGFCTTNLLGQLFKSYDIQFMHLNATIHLNLIHLQSSLMPTERAFEACGWHAVRPDWATF